MWRARLPPACHCISAEQICCPFPRCLPHVVFRTLSAAHCPLHVVCCNLSAACCLLHVVFAMFPAARCLPHVVRRTLSAARCPLHVVFAMFPAAFCLLHCCLLHVLSCMWSADCSGRCLLQMLACYARARACAHTDTRMQELTEWYGAGAVAGTGAGAGGSQEGG